jgi:hypothetical protein
VASTVEQRRKLLAKEFFVDCNMTAAYMRVYHPKSLHTATVNAGRLLTNADMVQYLQEEFDALQQRIEFQQDQALLEICLLAYSSLKNVASWGPGGVDLKDSETLDDGIARTVQDVECVKKVRTYMRGDEPVEEVETRTRIKLHSKTQALGMLQEFFRRGDPLSSAVENKIATLVMIMGQYVSPEQLSAFRTHVAATLGIRLPTSRDAARLISGDDD